MNRQFHMWIPDSCDSCVKLFQDSSSKDQGVSSKALFILKEIMRNAEASASRKNPSGFVSKEAFAFHLKDWMGTFNNIKSVRRNQNTLPSPLPVAGETLSTTRARHFLTALLFPHQARLNLWLTCSLRQSPRHRSIFRTMLLSQREHITLARHRVPNLYLRRRAQRLLAPPL